MKPRTFIVKKNLYLYFDEEGWSEDNPTEYGRDYDMTAKDVRDELLTDIIYKGTKLSLVKNDSGLQTDCSYGLARKNGEIVVFLESENEIFLDWFEEEGNAE
jgi:hypothetical protein